MVQEIEMTKEDQMIMYMKCSKKEICEMLNNLDLAPILENRVRQVRWLYNNSNKCTLVYEEKLVRVMIHKLQERIKELENTQPINQTNERR